jgi:hypothetical protein
MPAGPWQHGMVPEHQNKKVINIQHSNVNNSFFPLLVTGKLFTFL